MSARRVVVVDVETSALTPNTKTSGGNMLFPGTPVGVHGVAVEVAWHDLSTDERGEFVPRHNTLHVRGHGAPQALVVNRYLERLVDAEQDDGTAARALHERLTGATLAGSNPAFDARFLRQLFKRTPAEPLEPWHHRLADLAAYAGGRLGIDPGELPGLAAICERLDVAAPDHTAAGDVRATVECFRKLKALPYATVDHAAIDDERPFREQTVGEAGLTTGTRSDGDAARWSP